MPKFRLFGSSRRRRRNNEPLEPFRINFRKWFAFRAKLNVKFLALLFVSFAVLAAAVHFVHKGQVKKFGALYLNLANQAMENGEVRKEAGYLSRYLSLNPKDAEALARLGMAQSQTAQRGTDVLQAFLTLQDALRLNPELPAKYRIESVNLALNPVVNAPDDARRELDTLIEADPENAEYKLLYARSYMYDLDFIRAEEKLRQAIEQDQNLVTGYAELAWLLRRQLSRPSAADETIATMLAANPQSAYAHLVAGQYWQNFGDRDKWASEIALARQLAPDDPETQFANGELTMVLSREAADKGTPEDNERAEQFRLAAVESFAKVIEAVPAPGKNERPPARGSKAEREREALLRSFTAIVRAEYEAENLEPALEWANRSLAAFPDNPNLLLERAEVNIRREKYAAVQQDLDSLTKVGFSPGMIDYTQARVAYAQEQWELAARALERAIPVLASQPSLQQRANLFLAECYGRLGEIDRRYEAFRRAVPADPLNPNWGPAVAGMASTLASMGRNTEAMVEFQKLVNRGAAAARIPLARLMTIEMARRPENRQDWDEVKRMLNRAPDGVNKQIAQAELLAAQGKLEQADELLQAAAEDNPDAKAPWEVRIALSFRTRNWAKAEKLLEAAEKQLGDQVTFRLLRGDLAFARRSDKLSEVIPNLAEGADIFDEADQARLWTGLASMAMGIQNHELAKEYLSRVSRLQPKNINLLYRRLDLANLSKDKEAAAEIVEKIESISGGEETVPARLAKAFQLLQLAEQGDRSQLAKVTSLLNGLERLRGGWSRIYLAQGRAADLSGDFGLAARKYQQAVDLGELRPEIVTRLLEIYYSQRQFAEADKLMRSIPNPDLMLGTREDLLAELAYRNQDYARAAELAKKLIDDDSDDPAKLILLARTLVLADRVKEAEAPFRKAAELAPNQVEPWVALVQFLHNQNRSGDASATIQEIQAKVTNPNVKAQTLAQCYELLGDFGKAKEQYQELLTRNSQEVEPLKSAASFFMRTGDLGSARPVLERIMSMPNRTGADEQFARRLLAICLASSRDFKTQSRALEILGIADLSKAGTLKGDESPEEIRARIIALVAQKGRTPRQAAARLFEALERASKLTPDDNLLYGQIQEALGNWPGAKVRYRLAAQADDSQELRYVKNLTAALIRRKEESEAASWIERLQKSLPDDSATVELQARYLDTSGKSQEAKKLIEDYVAKSERHEVAARTFEAIGQHELAEQHFNAWIDSTDRADARFLLAGFLARAGRVSEAIEQFDLAAQKLPNEVIIPALCETVLTAFDKASPDDIEQVLQRAKAAAKSNQQFQVLVAALKSLAGDYQEAIRMSRDVLQREPNNSLAMNNLAYLIAAKEQRYEEALKLVRRAIELEGPQPTLLDTEGYILLAAGKPNEAVRTLQEAVVDDPTPVSYLHLAQAYLAAGKRTDAITAMAEARKRKVNVNFFHPLEREKVKETLEELRGI